MDEQTLKDYIIEELKKRGDTDIISVTNIRPASQDALILMADVSYTCNLHGCEKHAEHKDVLFVYKDGKLYFSLLMRI